MVWLRCLLVTVAIAGCTTNHDTLARRPPASGGASGSGGTGGTGLGSGNTGNVANGGRVNPDDEPAGVDVLTIVNGVVDADSVRLCFARLGEGAAEGELVGEPMQELNYARSTVLTELPGLDFETDTIQPWVLSGDFSLLDGLSCQKSVELARQEEAKVTPHDEPRDPGLGGAPGAEEAAGGSGGAVGETEGGAGGGAPDPGPALEKPALRARPVAALPSGSLVTGRSLLLVLSGCLGGAYYRDAIQASICGQGYAPDEPSVQPVLVKLSRDLAFDKVGLQAVQAALAVGSVDVKAGSDGALTFASGLGFGSIAPRPADVRFGIVELGISAIDSGLQAVGSEGVLLERSWFSIRDASGIDSIATARSYTAILIGPDPLVIKHGWWHEATFTLVDNDPTRK